MKSTLSSLALMSLALFPALGAAQAKAFNPLDSFTRSIASPSYVEGEVLVKLKAGVRLPARGVQALFPGMDVVLEEQILTAAMRTVGEQTGVLLLRTTRPVPEMIELLKADPRVEVAEPNFIVETQQANDTHYVNGNLWGVYGKDTVPSNQFGVGAANSWMVGHTGRGDVIVGVIDEGIMATHEDLQGQIWVNPFEPVDGIDNDGNGFVDDNLGWDFYNNDRSTYDDVGDNHGTHVAGTIGAKGNNGIGVAGVSWGVKMIPIKFLQNSGSTANAIKSFDYLTDLKTRHGLKIVASNNSWGGGGFSQTLKDAITRCEQANILTVCAAGNNGRNTDTQPFYPSCYDNPSIISVASITSTGARSSFSNYGAVTVDIGAPGSGIWSTVPGTGNTSAYASYNGTSMAAPHMTGVLALMVAAEPALSGLHLKNVLLARGTATSSLVSITLTGDRANGALR